MSEPASTLAPEAFYSARDVAWIVFGRGREWFYRHRKALRTEEGFPAPVSKYGSPKWSGERLLEWMQRPEQGASAPSKVVSHDQLLAARARRVAVARRATL